MSKLYYIIEEPFIWTKPYYGLQSTTAAYVKSKPVTNIYSNLEKTITAVRKLMQHTNQYIYIVEVSEDGSKDITNDIIRNIEDADAMANKQKGSIMNISETKEKITKMYLPYYERRKRRYNDPEGLIKELDSIIAFLDKLNENIPNVVVDDYGTNALVVWYGLKFENDTRASIRMGYNENEWEIHSDMLPDEICFGGARYNDDDVIKILQSLSERKIEYMVIMHYDKPYGNPNDENDNDHGIIHCTNFMGSYTEKPTAEFLKSIEKTYSWKYHSIKLDVIQYSPNMECIKGITDLHDSAKVLEVRIDALKDELAKIEKIYTEDSSIITDRRKKLRNLEYLYDWCS